MRRHRKKFNYNGNTGLGICAALTYYNIKYVGPIHLLPEGTAGFGEINQDFCPLQDDNM
jgi:hypothetical protein